MSYSAGNLELDIEVLNKATRKANNVIKKLNTMSNTAMTFSANFQKAQPAVEKFFSSLKSNLGDISGIENIENVAKAFKSISNLSKLADLDYDKISEGFTKLASGVKVFIEEVNKGEASLNSLASALTTITKGKTSRKSEKSVGLIDLAELQGILYGVKRVFGTIRSMVNGVKSLANYGADYVETLHFWEVAMGDNIDKAEEFINKMNKAYSISEKTLLNAQAIFKNMFSSLGGVSDEISYRLSETITQMAVDFSSLYNTSFDEAFTKFQAILSGQVRPIRSVSGYDITEQTLEELYKTLGGTKSVRNLTITEKRLLSILSIFNQMEASGAIGDLGATVDSFANRSKQLSDSWSDLKTNIGLVVTTILEATNVLPFLIGVVKGLGNIFKAISNTIKASENADKISSSLGNVFGSTTDGANDASEAIEKLNGNFLDFDKFRVLNASESGETVGLDEEIVKAIEKYESILGNVGDAATEIAEKVQGIFGVFYDENGELKITETSLSNISVLLGTIATSLLLIGGTTVVGGIAKLVKLLGDLKAFGTFFSSAFSLIGGFVGTFLLLNTLLGLVPEKIRPIITAITTLGAALMAVLATKLLLEKNIVGGLAAIGVALGAVTAAANNFEIPQFAKGASDIDGGTLFVAGEMGKTEAVYTGENGKSNVANISQLKQAFYGALVDWSAQNKGSVNLTVNLDGETVYKNTTKHAKLHGNNWA